MKQITSFSCFPIDNKHNTIESFLQYEDALWYSLDKYSIEHNVNNVQIFFTKKNEIIERTKKNTLFIFLPGKRKIKALTRLIKEIRKSSVLYINTELPIFFMYCISVLSKMFDTRIVHFFHNVIEFKKLSKLELFFLKRYYSNVDIFIINTKYLEKEYKKLEHFKNKQFYIFPWGADPTLYHPININKKIKGKNELIVLYAGRIDQDKKIEDIIDSLLPLNNVIFWMVGGKYNNEYFEHIINRIEGNHVKYKYFGYVATEDLPKIYSTADIFVNMRPNEGFGKVFIESMSCGTPVIGRKGSPGPEEIIIEGRNGYMVENVTGLTDKLKYLIMNRDELHSLSESCIQFVKSNYSYEKAYGVIKEINNLLEIKKSHKRLLW